MYCLSLCELVLFCIQTLWLLLCRLVMFGLQLLWLSPYQPVTLVFQMQRCIAAGTTTGLHHRDF